MKKRMLWCAILALALLLPAMPAGSQSPGSGEGGYGVNTAPEKGGTDKRTLQGVAEQKGGLSADQQSNKQADLELAKKIRRAITQDDSLSARAENVKVITRDGTVTLNGMVKTAEEKNKIRDKAAEIAGADKVTDNLAVDEKK